jgi:hypothetical protein
MKGKKSAGRQKKPLRVRSEIQFPSRDLEDAIEVAVALAHAGSRSDVSGLAAALSEEPSSGGFRKRVAAARLFGLLDLKGRRYGLTARGERLAADVQSQPDRAEAFLHVPLYRRIYDSFGNGLLPSRTAIEDTFIELGVSQKESARARQTFERSAEQAGFFAHGKDRLAAPTSRNVSGAGSSTKVDPLIGALLEKLPPPGEPWPVISRVRWLRTLATVLSQIYDQNGEDSDVEITAMRRRRQ